MDVKTALQKEKSHSQLRELNLRLWDQTHNLELAIEQELAATKRKRKQQRKQLTRLAKYLDQLNLKPETITNLLINPTLTILSDDSNDSDSAQSPEDAPILNPKPKRE